ncbi:MULTISPECIES: LysM peptidoglycan-binding domain-containing protein [unclassified Schaalia]|uniref:LysM peptidoglycan-binding domain-containing protein n=1 Tax=Schaalia sp. ZJ1691 TaxID=2709404 RepID=UPI001E33BC21|nr:MULTISPECIES: LysM peptidoglycan-binding domain-containing protein [unclassified Schaalia]
MNTRVVGGMEYGATRRPHLEVVPDRPEAQVRDIFSAPSAVRRRQVLRQEDPAMHRRPVCASARHRQAPVTVSLAPVRADVLKRVVMGVVVALVLALVGIGAGILAQPAAYAGETRVHSVAAGESLWSLAAGVTSDRPLEDIVVDIESLNNLDGALTVGQKVVLPVR